jgi:hypothetical protein
LSGVGKPQGRIPQDGKTWKVESLRQGGIIHRAYRLSYGLAGPEQAVKKQILKEAAIH